jgi:uncharacterized protein (TIGR02217 family)
MPRRCQNTSTRCGPKFDTTINSALSGVEQRITNRTVSRGEWQIGYGLRTAGDWKPILALHYAQRGSLYGHVSRLVRLLRYQSIDRDGGRD